MALTPLEDALNRIRAMIISAPTYGDQLIPILLDLCQAIEAGGGGGGVGTPAIFGKFVITGTTQTYNLQELFGTAAPLSGVIPVFYDTQLLPSANYTFNPATQELTFLIGVQDGIEINIGYTL